jgi:hypothetical protein
MLILLDALVWSLPPVGFPSAHTLALGHAAALAALAAFYLAVAALVQCRTQLAVVALGCLAEWAVLYTVALYTT